MIHVCPLCDGRGWKNDSSGQWKDARGVRCGVCGGSGVVSEEQMREFEDAWPNDMARDLSPVVVAWLRELGIDV